MPVRAERIVEQRICPVCTDTFTIKSSNRNQRYCSLKCKGLAQRGKPSGKKKPTATYTCVECGKIFQRRPPPPSRRGRADNDPEAKRYCDKVCQNASSARRVKFTCEGCGKQWEDKPRSLSHARKRVFCSSRCVGMDTIRRLQHKKPTSIETETYAALYDLDVAFVPQHRIGRWLIDAFVPSLNLAIECLGDFHHCNPRRYPSGPKYEVQRKTVERDERRRSDLRVCGVLGVELWESDIRAFGAKALLADVLNQLARGTGPIVRQAVVSPVPAPRVRGGTAKLTEDDVRTIRHLWDTEQKTIRELQEIYCMSHSQIWQIVHRNWWKHVESPPMPIRNNRPVGAKNYNAKLAEPDVRVIRSRFPTNEATAEEIRSLASEYGVTGESIRKVLRRLTWRHLP